MNLKKKKISILLADDHKLLMDTMAKTLETDDRFFICGKASGGTEAIEIAKQKNPDIILMDVNLGEPDGFETTRMIRKELPGTKIIGLSMFVFPAYAKKMKASGGMGYVTKSSTIEELATAISEVNEGNYYFCEQVREFMNDKPIYLEGKEIEVGSLTNREIEVALLIKDGLTSKEIADQLYLSPKTINIHRNNIFKKLKVKSTAAMLSVLRYLGL